MKKYLFITLVLVVFLLTVSGNTFAEKYESEKYERGDEIDKKIKEINKSLVPKFHELSKLVAQKLGRKIENPVELEFGLTSKGGRLRDVTIVVFDGDLVWVGCESESTQQSCMGPCPC